MAKITRTFLAAFVCAIFCSLFVATTAWADGAKPTDANGKWIPGEYEYGTVTVKDAHPGMEATANASFPELPAKDSYYSHGVSVLWYASENGVDGWTKVAGGVLSTRLPDEGEAGYEDVVNHYVKAVTTHEYSMAPSYTSTGEFGVVTLISESEPVYVEPHDGTQGVWATDGATHWLTCSKGPNSQCQHRINPAACQLASDSWSTSVDTHDKWCTTCGVHYGPEKHCFDEFIVEYLEQNPQGVLPSTVHPTCDICKRDITMSSNYFLEKWVVPGGFITEYPPSDEGEEDPGTTGQEDGTPQPEDPKVEEPADQEAPEQTQPEAQVEAEAEAQDQQATFARTGDATPTHLLAAGILAAGALALIARKRLAA